MLVKTQAAEYVVMKNTCCIIYLKGKQTLGVLGSLMKYLRKYQVENTSGVHSEREAYGEPMYMWTVSLFCARTVQSTITT